MRNEFCLGQGFDSNLILDDLKRQLKMVILIPLYGVTTLKGSRVVTVATSILIIEGLKQPSINQGSYHINTQLLLIMQISTVSSQCILNNPAGYEKNQMVESTIQDGFLLANIIDSLCDR